MILMWNLHWHTQYSQTRTWALYDAKNDTLSWTFIKEFYSAAFTMYFIWCIGYYLLVFVILDKRIKERHYMTLVAYHVTKGTGPGKLYEKYGPKYEGIMYCLSHAAGVCIFFTLALICFFSYHFHVLVIVFTSSVSFLSGASFYMDYFSKKYEVNLSKLDEIKTRVSEDLANSPKKKK